MLIDKNTFKVVYNIAAVTLYLTVLGINLYFLKQYENFSLTETNQNPSDFLMYLTGATIIKEQKTNMLYDAKTQEDTQRRLAYPKLLDNGLLAFRTPPIVAIMYLPFTYLNNFYAFYISVVLNFLIIVLTLTLLIRHYRMHINHFLSLLTFFTLFMPIFTHLGMGQLSLLITLIIVISLLTATSNSYFSGLVIALVCLKPQYAMYIPLLYFIQTNRRTFIHGLLMGLITFAACNIVIYGHGLLTDYPKFVLVSENIEYGTSPEQNYNLVSIALLFTQDHSIALFIASLFSLLFYVVLLIFFQNRSSTLMYIVGSMILVPILSPHTMVSDLVTYLIPLTLVLKSYIEKMISKQTLFYTFAFIWLFTWIGVYGIQYIAVAGISLIGVYFLTLKKL